jgi:DNA-binding NarL/FixJ family response regulator
MTTTVPPAIEASKPVQGVLRRLQAAEERLEAARAHHAATRQEAVATLLAQGLSYSQVAGLLGVSKQRAFQIGQGA